MNSSNSITTFTLDQHRIRTDGDLVCLNDLHVAAGSPPNQDPRHWVILPTTKQLIDAVAKNLNVVKSDIYKTRRGRHNGGTWAHKILAVDYAGYLSADFKRIVNDTFLKVEEGDLSIIDRVMDRTKAPIEEQKKAAARMQSKVVRNHHTEVLQEHGVTGKGFAMCTNATYKPLLGGTAGDIRKARNLPAKANIRDNLSFKEISAIMLSEALADERIEEEDRRGDQPCAVACYDASKKVASIL
jgi:hypothetical protein